MHTEINIDKFETPRKHVPEKVEYMPFRKSGFEADFGFEKSVMHDPLAVASAFADICRFEKRYVKTSDTNRGAVEAHESQNGGTSPVYVAEDVNPSAFYRLIREQLL